MTLDVARAVERNNYWSRRLSWAQHHEAICGLFNTRPSNAAEFAAAVAQWQHYRRPPLEPDGIIGPNTWEAMRLDLGLGPSFSPPSVPRPDATEEVHSFTIRGHTIRFYDFINEPGTPEKIGRLREMFERMPNAHLRVVYPIFLVRRHRHQDASQEGSGGGATLGYPQTRIWSRRHSENSGIPMALIQRVVLGPRSGMITIPRHRWRRDFLATGGPGIVVPHEIGHNIDFELHLVPPGGSTASFPGLIHENRSKCGHGTPINRQVSEAYRMLISGSRRLYHFLPPGMSSAETNRAIMASLRASRAFAHVPPGWFPQER